MSQNGQTHFKNQIPFIKPLESIRGFLMFSGGTERDGNLKVKQSKGNLV